MSHEFPGPVRDLLGRQTPGEVHPSADLLNAYFEHSLNSGESSRITSHLAACAECREVLFLAHDSARKQDAAAVAAPSPRWLRWRWAVPAAALLTIVSAVLVQHYRTAAAPGQTPALARSSKAPAVPATTPGTPAQQQQRSGLPVAAKSDESALEKRVGESGATSVTAYKKGLQRTSPVPRTAEVAQLPHHEARNAVIPAAPARPPALAGGTATKALETQPQTPGIEIAEDALVKTSPPAAAPLAVPPMRSSLVSSPQGSPEAVGGPPAPAPANQQSWLTNAHRWRVTSDGHLERFGVAGAWVRVLPDEPSSFHVVAVTGSSIWAGGSRGSLFHSTDGGEHWIKVTLAAADKVEDGSIVSIRFNSAQQGTVTTEAGSLWLTSDGGQTWVRQ